MNSRNSVPLSAASAMFRGGDVTQIAFATDQQIERLNAAAERAIEFDAREGGHFGI